MKVVKYNISVPDDVRGLDVTCCKVNQIAYAFCPFFDHEVPNKQLNDYIIYPLTHILMQVKL